MTTTLSATTIPTIISDDLALQHEDDGTLTVVALDPAGSRSLGTFDTPGDAWAAIDQLDAPVVDLAA